MRKIILIAVLFSLLLSVSIAYSQTVTGWEREVYYELVDRVDRTYSLPEGATTEDENGIYREIAEKNGLTFGEIKDIEKRVLDQGLTDREWEICDEIDGRLDDLPFYSSQEEEERVYGVVANKYGITQNVLVDIWIIRAEGL